MKICAIIPCFNHADYVANAINSVFRQKTDAYLQVIAVDDGSSDQSWKLLTDMASEEPRLRVIKQTHQGAAAARNAGLDALDGACDLVVFVDSDDVMCVGRLATDLHNFADVTAIDFTYGTVRIVDRMDYVTGQPTRTARTRQISGPHLGAALFSRTFLDRIGLFDTGFEQGEDIDFLLRAFEAGPKFVQNGTVGVNILRHSGNLSNNTAAARRGMLKALQKSVARRRSDPAITIRRPVFAMQSLAEIGFS